MVLGSDARIFLDLPKLYPLVSVLFFEFPFTLFRSKEMKVEPQDQYNIR